VCSSDLAVEREQFDLFICDLSLPDGHGADLLPRLRSCSQARYGGKPVPAIAMSGSVYESDVTRCLAAGFTSHLAKPFDEQGLLATIAAATQQRARANVEAVGNGGVPSPVPARLR